MDMVAKLEGTADERGHPGPGLSGKARVGGSNPTPEVWGGGVDSTTPQFQVPLHLTALGHQRVHRVE